MREQAAYRSDGKVDVIDANGCWEGEVDNDSR